jgi:trans-aconitate 2-methyltransferase
LARETPTWDPREYLKFERERTLPCRDLVSRIELESPQSIVDLGCGPGNSTQVLAERWPAAKITGVDNSEDMLARARKSSVAADWRLSDIREWSPDHPFELVFSNAVYQWLPNQDVELPRLFRSVAANGVFAFQIPSGEGEWTTAIRRVAELPAWEGRFKDNLVDLRTPDVSFYYDLLSPLSRRIDAWQTQYVHVFPAPEMVVEWTSGTALRPLLDLLSDKEERAAFLADYTEEVSKAYQRRADGNVLFPFLRRFVVAYR